MCTNDKTPSCLAAIEHLLWVLSIASGEGGLVRQAPFWAPTQNITEKRLAESNVKPNRRADEDAEGAMAMGGRRKSEPVPNRKW